MVISSVIGALIILSIYQRYVPVIGISSVQNFTDHGELLLLDLRDYQTSSKKVIPNSINIPYAYLKRYYKEIPNKKLLIIASDSIEKNLAIRFLRKRQFSIHGFMILDEKRSENKWSMISKQKIG
ncbi:sulfurtransferase [Neobacillus sp. PS2-9]|uniref:sulfurtransferase n=1 Tax=Neobacillus sp. PS2-9 TaxID=3070676 RepID=UPI0027E161E5|nr:sulfurtransferase [Neobacillus sp. PS2-9]WML60496.1 sulfurtransferase [Neobacillus sp. PS2-9]